MWRFFYAQARKGKFAAEAACGPRGEQGRKDLPYSIGHAHLKVYILHLQRTSHFGLQDLQ